MTTATRLQKAAFAVLLVATLGAFLLANQLKSQPPDIKVIRRDILFSPNGDGRLDRNSIIFAAAFNGRAAIDVVDADGSRVRRLAAHRRLRRGHRSRLSWDGRTDAGRRAPDGEYRLRFILDNGRSLLAPKPFVLDTVPPKPTLTVDGQARVVAPGQSVPFTVAGAGPEVPPQFAVVRTDVTPPRTVRTLAGVVGRRDYTWDGRMDDGAVAPPGVYLIAVTAEDRAGNRGQVPPLPLRGGPVGGDAGVTVRRLALQPPVRAVRAGDLFNVRVDARGQAFTWTLRRLGTFKPVDHGAKAAGKTNLVLQAPHGLSGVYMLRAQARGASATVPIVVRARVRKGPLIVLPMMTWLGRDPVDTDGDGIPDVYGTGSAVRYPRLFGAAPAGFFSEVAPLLLWLDEGKVRYDLATDLDLDFSSEPTADQRAVVMPGRATWISRAVAGRLRTWVQDGGRLALFGPDALRASVSVGDSVLARPSTVTPVDALGGRLDPVRAVDKPLSVLAEDPALGLLEGFSGVLPGFSRIEELTDAGPGEVKTSVGEPAQELRPALSAVTQGKGIVIRVGLPGWMAKLRASEPAIVQLTANILDVLRHQKPHVRTAKG